MKKKEGGRGARRSLFSSLNSSPTLPLFFLKGDFRVYRKKNPKVCSSSLSLSLLLKKGLPPTSFASYIISSMHSYKLKSSVCACI